MDSAEIINNIIAVLLKEPVFLEPNWDAMTVIVDVSLATTSIQAYRYKPGQLAKPTQIKENAKLFRLFRNLQQVTAGPQDQFWQVCLVKIERDTAKGKVEFFYGEDANQWYISAENFKQVSEALRPTPQDFQ